MRKTFVLDTNILIHDNESIYSFADNHVVIPINVIEELDNLKVLRDEKGFNARAVTRKLDSILMAARDVEKEVPLGEGTLRVEYFHNSTKLPSGFDPTKKDNMILQTALHLKEQGEKVIFVSKDLNMRIKARSLGLEVQDYEKAKVNYSDLYAGWMEIQVTDTLIDRFYRDRRLDLVDLKIEKPFENCCLVLKSESGKSAIGRIKLKMSSFEPLSYNGEDVWGVHALNVQQRFTLDLLLDDSLSIVTLLGTAGTGKTLLAVAAAFQKTFDQKQYKKVLVARPIMPLGKDIGYLPGTKDEKLSAWMQPVFDNIYYLLSQNSTNRDGTMPHVKDELDYLMDSNLVELGAITYMRGRSIPKQFVIIDEAQNLSPHEVKTIVSRIGENSKIVLTGDPEQIDNPYLDADSNGLNYLVDRFKGQDLFGSCTLVKSERSVLASLAVKLL